MDDQERGPDIDRLTRSAHREGLDPAITAWLRILRIHQRINARTAATMAQFGLTVSRFDILNHAGNGEGRSQQELADALLVTKGNITQVLDGMESCGLIRRERDGRTKRIYLTDHGRELRARSLAIQNAQVIEEFSALDPDQLTDLQRLLSLLERSLR